MVYIHNFYLNDIFNGNAKVYQSKPVMAAKYKPGMENGFVVYFANKGVKNTSKLIHEGMKFFDTEMEAWDFINRNEKQYALENNRLVEMEAIYDSPKPVLLRKEKDITKKVGFIRCVEEKYAFESNETEKYDFFILESDSWIIRETDGSVRVWHPDLEETFFGEEKDIVYEKHGKVDYVKVAV